MSAATERDSAAYWLGRLYRNSFTYRGERRDVAGWCVKIQWRGARRTVRLQSPVPAAAAEEAAQMWADLRRGGWSAVDARRRAARGAVAGNASEVPVIGLRKYVSDLNPGFHRELLASLPVESRVEHYALGTEDPAVARLRARQMQDDLIRDGAARLRLSHAREATIAVFWHANPMACTYTTLLTIPTRPSTATNAPRPRGWRVLVVESDGGVRRALESWLGRDPGVARIEGVPQATEAVARTSWDLVLANREQPASALRTLAGMDRPTRPRLVMHGCFADSDAIFASFSGVSRGYILCRVLPAQLLVPLTEAFPDGPVRGQGEEDRQIRRYFQSIFEPGGSPGLGQLAELSVRELEILDLLARGFADKEVARELGISGWTVHSHLKRIFAKYGVRTRTEAVVKHLQK